MSGDPFSVLEDERVASVLRRLHDMADSQTPRLLLHYLPKVPSIMLGRALRFDREEMEGYYADKYIALEREQAAYCYLTARSIRARCVVEFGTSFGVSTLWLAAAVRANGGGQVIGTELVPGKVEQARAHVEEAGLSEFVEIRQGDALQTLQQLPSEVDLLLNDGFPNHAIDVVKLVAPKMREGGAVITDNVGTFKGNYRDYVAYMSDPANGFASVIVPFKSGTLYSVRRT